MEHRKKIHKKKIQDSLSIFDDIDDEFSVIPDRFLRAYFRARNGRAIKDPSTYSRVKIELPTKVFGLLHKNKLVFFDLYINDKTAVLLGRLFNEIESGFINIHVFSIPFGGRVTFHIVKVEEPARSILPVVRLVGWAYTGQGRPISRRWLRTGIVIGEDSIRKGASAKSEKKFQRELQEKINNRRKKSRR